MPVITLSESTYGKLKELAEPFVDTEESVILAALEALSKQKGMPTDKNGAAEDKNQIIIFTENDNVSLTHTRLQSASVNGKRVYQPKWNTLMQEILVIGYKQLHSFEALKKVTRARLRAGFYEDEGFKYIPEVDMSVQGVSANGAWDISLELARYLRIPIIATFEWHNNPKAFHPGRKGELRYEPH